METLTEKEWLLVNDIIKEIYAADDIRSMEETFLLLIRKLVPYKTAVFSLVNEDFTVDVDRTTSVGNDPEDAVLYNEQFAEQDYTNDILSYPKSTVYRDTDIIDEERKRQTPFYRDMLFRMGCEHQGGLLVKAGGSNACVTFFRSDLNGPLKDKDLFVLELFIGHLENIVSWYLEEKQKTFMTVEKIKGFELLSAREKEILPFILQGYSNGDLAEKFVISDSTAKKHVYNILMKFNVSSRGELIKYCVNQSR